MPACILRCLASDFRRVCAIMVHLTLNDTERGKSAYPCKIELCKRYHSETPCKVCPKQFAAYPETPEQIERGLYHAITPEPIGNSLTGSRTAGTDTDRTGICWKRSEQPRTISAGTDTALSCRPRRNDSALCSPAPTDTDRSRNAWTNRADRISPE